MDTSFNPLYANLNYGNKPAEFDSATCATFSNVSNELESFDRGEMSKTTVGLPNDATQEESALLRRSEVLGEQTQRNFGKEEDEKGKLL